VSPVSNYLAKIPSKEGKEEVHFSGCISDNEVLFWSDEKEWEQPRSKTWEESHKGRLPVTI